MRRLVSYGHSWVGGAGASSSDSSLVALVARQLELTLDNEGVGGSNSIGTAELVEKNPPSPALVYLLMTGLNDLRLYGDAPVSLQDYSDALETILEAFRKSSPNALVVAIAQPYLIDFSLYPPHNKGSNALVDLYNRALLEFAARHPHVVVAEATGWNAGSMLDDDTVHPNDAGHLCLAQATTAAVTAAWQANSLLDSI